MGEQRSRPKAKKKKKKKGKANRIKVGQHGRNKEMLLDI